MLVLLPCMSFQKLLNYLAVVIANTFFFFFAMDISKKYVNILACEVYFTLRPLSYVWTPEVLNFVFSIILRTVNIMWKKPSLSHANECPEDCTVYKLDITSVISLQIKILRYRNENKRKT